MKKMTTRLWKSYKTMNKTIPRCVCCNIPILVGHKYEPLNCQGNNTRGGQKYLCEEHSKLYKEKGCIVYQHPIPNKKQKTFFGVKGE